MIKAIYKLPIIIKKIMDKDVNKKNLKIVFSVFFAIFLFALLLSMFYKNEIPPLDEENSDKNKIEF